MDIREEKRFVYSMMDSVTKERRALGEVYMDLKKRLDALNELEMRGLDELGVKGYFDMYNERNKAVELENIKRELTHSMNPTTQMQSDIPAPSLQKQAVQKAMEEKVVELQKPEVPKQKIPQKAIEESKERERKKKGQGNGQLDFNKVLNAIKMTLRESGYALSIKDIHKGVESKMNRKIPIANFRGNHINRALQDPTIERAGRGFYKYVYKNEDPVVEEEINNDEINNNEEEIKQTEEHVAEERDHVTAEG